MYRSDISTTFNYYSSRQIIRRSNHPIVEADSAFFQLGQYMKEDKGNSPAAKIASTSASLGTYLTPWNR